MLSSEPYLKKTQWEMFNFINQFLEECKGNLGEKKGNRICFSVFRTYLDTMNWNLLVSLSKYIIS